MKKIVLSMMLFLSMTTAMANNENNEASKNAYEFNVNISRLCNSLGLGNDQYLFLSDAMDTFSNDMRHVGSAAEEDRKGLMYLAIQRNLTTMRSLLTKSQYHRYLMLLNATINNRGLNK